MADIQNGLLFAPRLLVFITRAESEKKLEQLFDENHIPISYQCRAKGTAPSEMLDIFGLNSAARLITVGVLPKFMVPGFLQAAGRKLAFYKKGGGIALTIPITGLQSPIFHMLTDEVKETAEQYLRERTKRDMAEIQEKAKHAAIWVSVTSGYSDDVIDAAASAGAKGGTVLKGRRRSAQRVSEHLGISTQDGQDFVLIVVPKEKKSAVMAAISHACGLKTPAHGLVMSLPVDETLGLEE